MGRKKIKNKKEAVGFSIEPDLTIKLRRMPNSSAFVNCAIKEKIARDKDPHLRMLEVRKELRRIKIRQDELLSEQEDLTNKIWVMQGRKGVEITQKVVTKR